MAPGRKTGGRIKGVPNRVTTASRVMFLGVFDRLSPKLESWIERTADGVEQPLVVKGVPIMTEKGEPVMVKVGADPAKAADLLVRMAEYHLPKLGRQELVGDGGGAIQVVIQKYQGDGKDE